MNRHQLEKRTMHLTQWAFVNIPEVMHLIEEKGSLYEGEYSYQEESGIIDWWKFDDFISMYEAGNSDKFLTQNFIDEKITEVWHERYGRTVEEHSEEQLRWRRNDIPDNISFFEQATEDRKTPWMDGSFVSKMDIKELKKQNRTLLTDGKQRVGIMNDRDFRERCTKVGGNLHAIYEVRTEADLRIVHKAEWIQEQLECEYEDALSLAEAFKRLGITRPVIHRMFNGYWDDEQSVWKKGLKGISIERIRFYAKLFEELCIKSSAMSDAEEMELNRQFYHSVSQNMIESGDWCLQYGTNNPYWNDQMKYIEESVLLADGKEQLPELDSKDELDGFIGHFGDEEIEPPLNITATFRLWDGSEALDWDTIRNIKESEICKWKCDDCKTELGCRDIGVIIRKMYPQRNKPAEWGYNKTWWLSGWMTYAQTQEAWVHINEARERIADECKKYLKPESKKVLKLTKNMKPRVARAFVATYCAGNEFNLDGKDVKWKHKPCDHEKYAIWAEFRKGM